MIMYEKEKQASKRAKYCRKKHNWNKLYKQNWNLMIKNTKHTKKSRGMTVYKKFQNHQFGYQIYVVYTKAIS